MKNTKLAKHPKYIFISFNKNKWALNHHLDYNGITTIYLFKLYK